MRRNHPNVFLRSHLLRSSHEILDPHTIRFIHHVRINQFKIVNYNNVKRYDCRHPIDLIFKIGHCESSFWLKDIQVLELMHLFNDLLVVLKLFSVQLPSANLVQRQMRQAHINGLACFKDRTHFIFKHLQRDYQNVVTSHHGVIDQFLCELRLAV